MKCKLRPSEEKSKAISEILFGDSKELITGFVIKSAEKILQEALEYEVGEFLGRQWYTHCAPGDKFKGYRNGYQDKHYKTAEGIMEIRKPRVRANEEAYESRILDKLGSIEDKLNKIALESYVRGLSTRDIESTFIDDIGEPLLSRSSVSKLAADLYKEYEEFSQRDLSKIDVVYLFIDGVYEAVRRYTRNQGILCAWAITSDGRKELLSLMAADSESTESYSMFFEDMLKRGLRQPLLVVSDGSTALISAITHSFPKADRQRCIAHKLRNLSVKVPRSEQKQINRRAKEVYYAADKATADVLAARFIDDYAQQYPSMVKCFTDDLQACLTQLKYPEGHRIHIRTTNLIERAFVEEKRRTKIIPQHQNERGAIGLVFSVLIRASYNWRKVGMTEVDLTELKHIRSIICPEQKESNYISYQLVA
jgi:putative transposase